MRSCHACLAPCCACCRDSPDSTLRDLKQAVKLLYAAAGIQHLSMARPTARAAGSEGGTRAAAAPTDGSASASPSGASGNETKQDHLTAASVKLVLYNDTVPHQGALKELVYVYREGGCWAKDVMAGSTHMLSMWRIL